MKSWTITLALIGLTIVLFFVGQSVAYNTGVMLGSSVPFKTVSEGPYSYQITPENLVINDQGTWSMVWTKTLCGPLQSCQVPSVDFTSTTLLAVFAGGEPYIDYSVNVTNLIQIGASLIARTTLWVPGNGCPIPLGAHSGAPYQIVAISKTESSALFLSRTFRVNCQPAVL